MQPAERAHYDEHGYVLVPGLFDRSEFEPWTRRFLDIASGRAAVPEGMLVMKDVMVAKGAVVPASREHGVAKIQDFQSDPVLYEGYVCNPQLLNRVESFTGPDIKSIHTMLINKPPDVDGRHPLHQDLLYFPFRPAARIVATWTALEPCTRENGCLTVVPGSHRAGLLEHENPSWEHLNFGYFGAKGEPSTERVHLEMEAGDTVFFHPLLLHGSGRNRSTGFRRAISAHYAGADCRYLEASGLHAPHRYRLVRGREHADGI